ncbi:MAG: hypothetical protein IKP88_18225 [Lachnospiraceae bacterium]|nr:hypothetical protein [Lachnospiraceae bacterium]
MKRYVALIISVMCLALCACNKTPTEDNTVTLSPEEQEKYDKLHEARMRRVDFENSELKTYSENYILDIVKDVFPDKNTDSIKIVIQKEFPTEEDIKALGGDTDKAFELFKTGDFTISVTQLDYSPFFTEEERVQFMDALGERGFTAHVEMGYYEYAYLVNGEVHLEPKPMY